MVNTRARTRRGSPAKREGDGADDGVAPGYNALGQPLRSAEVGSRLIMEVFFTDVIL